MKKNDIIGMCRDCGNAFGSCHCRNKPPQPIVLGTWKDVKNALPLLDERVLIVPSKTGIPVIGFISASNSFWHGVFSDGTISCDVDYWMEIPKPPIKQS